MFHTFDGPIDLNECDISIYDQKKADLRIEKVHTLALIIRKNETKHDLATFLTSACFNPVKSTLLKAIQNNHFSSWPGMDYKFMNKFLTPNIHSAKGHLNQERQGLQSTKQPIDIFEDATNDIKTRIESLKAKYPHITELKDLLQTDITNDAFPRSATPHEKPFDVAYSLVNIPPKHLAYTDLTGRFPYRSSSANE